MLSGPPDTHSASRWEQLDVVGVVVDVVVGVVVVMVVVVAAETEATIWAVVVDVVAVAWVEKVVTADAFTGHAAAVAHAMLYTHVGDSFTNTGVPTPTLILHVKVMMVDRALVGTQYRLSPPVYVSVMTREAGLFVNTPGLTPKTNTSAVPFIDVKHAVAL